jgi:hypothetical protein
LFYNNPPNENKMSLSSLLFLSPILSISYFLFYSTYSQIYTLFYLLLHSCETTYTYKITPFDYFETFAVAIAILGGYTSLYFVVKVVMYFTGGNKPKIEAGPAVSVVSSSAIPSIESPEFSTYLESDAFLTLLNSEDELTALLK